MPSAYSTPGVYREEFVLENAPPLATGVPGFAGFAGAGSELAKRLNEPVLLNRMSEFNALFEDRSGSPSPVAGYLADAVHGFFSNGGMRCYVVGAAFDSDPMTNEQRLKDALDALAPVTGLDLIAAPDAMLLEWASALRVQRQMLQQCASHGNRQPINRFAILDALPVQSLDQVIQQREDLSREFRDPVNAALYFPWLKIGTNRCLPPSGHIAGIFSRSDAETGVFKAPANEEVLGVLDLCTLNLNTGQPQEFIVDRHAHEQLNRRDINCLRAFPGRGIRVWGARTISSEPEWRYINVNRTVITLRRWIEMNLAWASFEPNTLALWVRIERELTGHLTELWRLGALAGTDPSEAFYVKCDAETNPAGVIEAGQVVTVIGLAPAVPAEFVVVRIVHDLSVEPR